MVTWIKEKLGTHEELWIWISALSALMFVASLLLIPFLIGRAPADLFVKEPEPASARGGGALVRKIARNLLGLVLLLVGALMLVLPGQGLLMVLLALLLLDFPGKRALVRRIVRRQAVWNGLQYFRKRAHRPPFERPA